jgi:glycosyltransferase involved in cell wall biosynthesis
VITSDYRLWGAESARNERHRARWVARDDFSFLGAINRKHLVEEQMKAQIMAYPCNYDELFCISVAEAQVAGIYAVTTNKGALPTTNMCTVANWDANDPRGDASFVETIKSILERPNLDADMEEIRKKALKRFSPITIAKFWKENVFK